MTMSQWADLPVEVLDMISKCLDSRLDFLCFRAVCTSWRYSASLPSFDQEVPRLILKLPPPFHADAILMQTAVCRIEPISKLHISFFPFSRSWLVKVGQSKYGKLQLLNPLTNHKIKYSPTSLNLIDFKFVQLNKAFSLQRLRRSLVSGITKFVPFPMSSSYSNIEKFGILAICQGKLGYWKSGDVDWTLLGDMNLQYEDIIVWKDQFYVIDTWGTVYWIHPSLKVIQYSPPLYGCGKQKNLVDSCGDLYVVDRYLDGEMRVYKLDEELGTWVDVKSLDDQIFVLGTDCSFSISCREFNGGKGNCIYFMDGDDHAGRGLTAGSIHVFQFEDRSSEKLDLIPDYEDQRFPPRHPFKTVPSSHHRPSSRSSQIFEMQSKLRMSQCNLSNLVSVSVGREGGIIHLTDTS
ncbi:hypothetical protein SADUNF_Sadunf05G0076500 [Salix dunnii]|uniref:KIB1-4 beta-propeller domain-containing protein n=1 Tax=Salix dunnii TaxID=1413687 RepID=A0A835N3K5_9ROSI|nr:hypothetical protein SADUNF_Sadunf05G0076500 [Salix dunnii]